MTMSWSLAQLYLAMMMMVVMKAWSRQQRKSIFAWWVAAVQLLL